MRIPNPCSSVELLFIWPMKSHIHRRYYVDFIKKGMKELPLKNIIMEAGNELGMSTQWLDSSSIDNRAKHIHSAEALIEVAEIMVCGSTGGFDVVKVGKKLVYQETRGEEFFPDHRSPEHGKYDHLFERWLWLFTFYVGGTDRTELGHKGWRNVGQLKKFFKAKHK